TGRSVKLSAATSVPTFIRSPSPERIEVCRLPHRADSKPTRWDIWKPDIPAGCRDFTPQERKRIVTTWRKRGGQTRPMNGNSVTRFQFFQALRRTRSIRELTLDSGGIR